MPSFALPIGSSDEIESSPGAYSLPGDNSRLVEQELFDAIRELRRRNGAGLPSWQLVLDAAHRLALRRTRSS